MRRLAVVLTADKDVLESLQNKCENYLLIFDISKKQIIAAKKSLQEKQVEENMMKLRISHIEKDKQKEEKHIFNLEKLRLNLEQVEWKFVWRYLRLILFGIFSYAKERFPRYFFCLILI